VATIGELLQQGIERLRVSGSETARLDAELLLGHALHADRALLVAHPEALVGDGPAADYLGWIGRRELGEPVAYIRGLKEFYGLAFGIDPRALIPRPETERLVELAEDEIATRLTASARPQGTPPIEVVDVGTGSGAIAIALAVATRRRGMLDELDIVGTDISPDAVQLARENAVAHAVADRVTFVAADLLPDRSGQHWDLVLANLPYVRAAAIAGLPRATQFEPRLALDGGADGLEIIGRLLNRLPSVLSIGGVALLEIGADQGEDVVQAVEVRLPGWRCRVELDLAQLPRVARVQRPG
jgi:release factor glutamine methyltransferase